MQNSLSQYQQREKWMGTAINDRCSNQDVNLASIVLVVKNYQSINLFTRERSRYT
jgi:hypothetical protein